MIFQHTLEQVLDGTKTQTSRIVKPGDRLVWNDDDNTTHFVVSGNGRLKWWVGNTYAVQPGYGKKAVARIRILKIWRMDVREFDPGDIAAEGFYLHQGFWAVWCAMHDKAIGNWMDKPWNQQMQLSEEMKNRPDERYQAWVLNFELEE